MSPILGIFASQGRVAANSYESIQTVTVGAGGSSSISFSSIPSTYKHLQIRMIGRDTTGSSSNGPALIYFNNDTGTTYDSHLLYGLGTSAGGAASTSRNGLYWIGEFVGTSNIMGAVVIDILEYANTNINKTVRSLGGFDSNGAGRIDYTSGLWRSTSAINRIDITNGAANWTSDSRFALYGIKG